MAWLEVGGVREELVESQVSLVDGEVSAGGIWRKQQLVIPAIKVCF
jgi:hypothetical protein